MIYEENTLNIEDIKKIREGVQRRMLTDHQLQQALDMTVYSIVVKDHEHSIAMGRLIGDGIYYLICDVAVLPDYQHQGIGTKNYSMYDSICPITFKKEVNAVLFN